MNRPTCIVTLTLKDTTMMNAHENLIASFETQLTGSKRGRELQTSLTPAQLDDVRKLVTQAARNAAQCCDDECDDCGDNMELVDFEGENLCGKCADRRTMTSTESRTMREQLVQLGLDHHGEWRFGTEAMTGCWYYAHARLAVTVYCTPDFEARPGEHFIPICATTDDGDDVRGVNDCIDWPRSRRSAQNFFEHVRPTLDCVAAKLAR